MLSYKSCLAGLVLAVSMLQPSAEAAPQATLLVLAQRDETLNVVDPQTLKILARIPAGHDPHEIAISPDSKTAFVTNYGLGLYHTITQIDLVAQSQVRSIDLAPLRGAHGATFVGGKLWFTAESNKAIGRLDPSTGKVEWVLGTGQDRTHMIYVSPDQSRIVTTNVSSGTVDIIDRGDPPLTAPFPIPPLKTGGPLPKFPPIPNEWIVTQVTAGAGPEGFAVSPDGRKIWVGNSGDGTVSVIDGATKHVERTLQLGIPWVNRLRFTPDGKRVLASQLFTPDLVVVDADTGKTIKRVQIGAGSAGILIQPDGARAYVGCPWENYVAVIDLNTLSMVAKITGGLAGADGMAWAVR